MKRKEFEWNQVKGYVAYFLLSTSYSLTAAFLISLRRWTSSGKSLELTPALNDPQEQEQTIWRMTETSFFRNDGEEERFVSWKGAPDHPMLVGLSVELAYLLTSSMSLGMPLLPFQPTP